MTPWPGHERMVWASMSIVITREELRQLLEYDEITGVFKWLTSLNRRIVVGSVAGTNSGGGYLVVTIGRRRYTAHQLAWLYVTGEWCSEIDHRNGCRSDNRIANLRPATSGQNKQNVIAAQSNNASGYRGVFFNKQRHRWQAHITIEGRTKYLGLFDSPQTAAEVYRKAKREFHPFNER